MSEVNFNLDDTNEKPKPKFVIKDTTPAKEETKEVIVEDAKKNIEAESKKEEIKNIVKKDKDIVTLKRNLYIRQYPGFWEHVLTYKQVTKEDKKNIVKGETYAILKEGTTVEIRRRINVIGDEVWGEISSGYIILKSKESEYVK